MKLDVVRSIFNSATVLSSKKVKTVFAKQRNYGYLIRHVWLQLILLKWIRLSYLIIVLLLYKKQWILLIYLVTWKNCCIKAFMTNYFISVKRNSLLSFWNIYIYSTTETTILYYVFILTEVLVLSFKLKL